MESIFANVSEWFAGVGQDIYGALPETFQNLIDSFSHLSESISSNWDVIKTNIQGTLELFDTVTQPIQDAFSALWEGLE